MSSHIAALEAMRDELSQALRPTAASEALAIERSADIVDDAMNADMRDRSAAELSRKRRLLSQVEGALSRHRSGTYGVCTTCEEPILAKRLDAVPWANRCRPCEDELDRCRDAR